MSKGYKMFSFNKKTYKLAVKLEDLQYATRRQLSRCRGFRLVLVLIKSSSFHPAYTLTTWSEAKCRRTLLLMTPCVHRVTGRVFGSFLQMRIRR